MQAKHEIAGMIEEKASLFTDASDRIWGFAEERFALNHSATLLCDLLAGEGFRVSRGLARMDDAFVAEYGEGSPVVGILAEYDALGNMNQKADFPEKQQTEPGKPGHGCQHNLLGAGAVTGAVGIKDYMEKHNLKGTVRLYGCPAEESGYGKAFMARDGVFDSLDSILTWHPMDNTNLWSYSSLAVMQAYFHFKGTAAHAAAAPDLGRSALDAAELMNIGVNFLREHIIDSGRIHYAFTDAGGPSANVVQPTASLYYFVRAPKSSQAKAIYDRVVKIAEGAALMTGTEVEVEFSAACADYLVNRTLGDVMYQNLLQAQPVFTQEELEYARPFCAQLSPDAQVSRRAKLQESFPQSGAAEIDALDASSINGKIPELTYPATPMMGSTDVGDASWIAPTAQVVVTTAPNGTPPHCWQWVATGKSSIAHKGMLAAGKTIAFTALDLLQNPAIVQAAKEEHAASLAKNPYVCGIPKNIVPK